MATKTNSKVVKVVFDPITKKSGESIHKANITERAAWRLADKLNGEQPIVPGFDSDSLPITTYVVK